MVTNNMNAIAWLRKRLEDSDADVIREMVEEFAGQLMSAEADALCNASYGERVHLERIIVPTEQYALSVVSAAELLHGVHRASGTRAQTRSAYVEGLLADFALIPIDGPVERAYARVSSTLARAGTSIDANDLWIGATAIAHELEVLELDGDFDQIPGVTRVGPAILED